MSNDTTHPANDESNAGTESIAYETPTILTHSGDELLAELGPAQACYPFSSGGIGD